MLTNITRVYPNTWPAESSTNALQLAGAPAKIQEGNLTVYPILVSEDSCFGAEVSGVDWSQPVPEAVVKQVSLAPVKPDST